MKYPFCKLKFFSHNNTRIKFEVYHTWYLYSHSEERQNKKRILNKIINNKNPSCIKQSNNKRWQFFYFNKMDKNNRLTHRKRTNVNRTKRFDPVLLKHAVLCFDLCVCCLFQIFFITENIRNYSHLKRFKIKAKHSSYGNCENEERSDWHQ